MSPEQIEGAPRSQRIVQLNVTDRLWEVILALLVRKYPLRANKAPDKENVYVFCEMDGWNDYGSEGGDKHA